MKRKIAIATLEARVRKRLALDGQKLTKFSKRWVSSCGEYGLLDIKTGIITAQHVDIEQLAGELGVLHGFEEVEYL